MRGILESWVHASIVDCLKLSVKVVRHTIRFSLCGRLWERRVCREVRTQNHSPPRARRFTKETKSFVILHPSCPKQCYVSAMLREHGLLGTGSRKTTKPGWLARLSALELVWPVLFRLAESVCRSQETRLVAVLSDSDRGSSHAAPMSLAWRRGVTVPRRCYITMARFSSSCIRTGRAHPAISTRPAASSAALGETP